MLIHYLLTGGSNPYGASIYDITLNVMQGTPHVSASVPREAAAILAIMLHPQPHARPTARDTLGYTVHTEPVADDQEIMITRIRVLTLETGDYSWSSVNDLSRLRFTILERVFIFDK